MLISLISVLTEGRELQSWTQTDVAVVSIRKRWPILSKKNSYSILQFWLVSNIISFILIFFLNLYKYFYLHLKCSTYLKYS